MALKRTRQPRTPTASFELAQYNAFLERRICARSPMLVERNFWDRELLIASVGKTLPAPPKTIRSLGTVEAARFPPYEFAGPALLRNEMKLYFIESLFEPRHESYQWWYYRRPLFAFLANEGKQVLDRFRVQCLADIPSPLRPASAEDFMKGTFKHNVSVRRTPSLRSDAGAC